MAATVTKNKERTGPMSNNNARKLAGKSRSSLAVRATSVRRSPSAWLRTDRASPSLGRVLGEIRCDLQKQAIRAHSKQL
jgi:hypothetical protein